MRKNVRKAIVDALKKHPEGLSIKEIAEAVGIHRINVSKYIYELAALGIIKKRRVGPAVLCYLNEPRISKAMVLKYEKVA